MKVQLYKILKYKVIILFPTKFKKLYDLEKSFITLGGDRYTVNNASTPEIKGGSVYFSWTVPFGKSPNNRTSFIMDNRPAADEVIGFGGAF